MNKLFYSALARSNIRKNKNTYFPYLLSCTVMISLFYILHAITQQVGTGKFYGDSSMTIVLNFGVYIAGGFSVILYFIPIAFLSNGEKKNWAYIAYWVWRKNILVKFYFLRSSIRVDFLY